MSCSAIWVLACHKIWVGILYSNRDPVCCYQFVVHPAHLAFSAVISATRIQPLDTRGCAMLVLMQAIAIKHETSPTLDVVLHLVLPLETRIELSARPANLGAMCSRAA